MLEEKVKNCVLKIISKDVDEEVRKINDTKIVKLILREAGVDENLVVIVEGLFFRAPGQSDYRWPVKIFANVRIQILLSRL